MGRSSAIPAAVEKAMLDTGMDRARKLANIPEYGDIYELYLDIDGDTPPPTGLPLLVAVGDGGRVTPVPTDEAFGLLARLGEQD